MNAFDLLRSRCAADNAARQFPAQPAISLILDPSDSLDAERIENATRFMMSRPGRARRTVYAVRHEVIFEFEDVADVQEFKSRF